MGKGNVNKIILLGNLGQDPELRQTAKGNVYLTFSMATHREFKNAEGEEQKETDWHRATVWGKRAENCAKYLTKGSRVYVEGELRMESWTDKDGIIRKSPEVMVDEIKFIDKKKTTILKTEGLEQATSLSQ